MYDYRVLDVLKVVDGDTLDCRIDLGLHLSAALRFRILGLDTPERGQPGWKEATDYVRAWLDGRDLAVETYKTDSFGRWLGNVYQTSAEPEGYPTLTAAVITYMDGLGIDCRWTR